MKMSTNALSHYKLTFLQNQLAHEHATIIKSNDAIHDAKKPVQ